RAQSPGPHRLHREARQAAQATHGRGHVRALAGASAARRLRMRAMPRGPRRRLLPVAALACAALSLGASPQHLSPLREIAIAEDGRRWSDGVLAGYLRDRDARVRARAALAVGRLQDSTSVTALLPLCVDADAGVRREAVFALGQIGQRSAGDSVAARLGDRDP